MRERLPSESSLKKENPVYSIGKLKLSHTVRNIEPDYSMVGGDPNLQTSAADTADAQREGAQR